MTRDELKTQLAPIVCDSTLTKEQRADKLGPIFATFAKEEEDNGTSYPDDWFNIWNETMAEIVIENNLGRQ